MMKTTQLLMGLAFVLSTIYMYGQSELPVVHFKSGDKVFNNNLQAFMSVGHLRASEEGDAYYHRYIQFSEIPNPSTRASMEASGVDIIEYLPDNTYLVAIPNNYSARQLVQFGVVNVIAPEVEDKLDQRLLTGSWPDWAEEANRVKVIIKFFDALDQVTCLTRLNEMGVSIKKEDIDFPIVYTTLDDSQFLQIAALSYVQFVDIGPDPGKPEDTAGRTLQRSNLINSQLSSGLKYDGSGVGVLIRDDGSVGPHIDFQGRLYDLTHGNDKGNHGDGVAGVFSGAGNLDPSAAGSASGADVYVINYESEFKDNTIELHEQNDIVITNSSYSNSCNAGYTITTQRVDRQMVNYPHLMHIFSAGNANGSECGYGAGNQWGNITGGHKQGKNVIAVANLHADGSIANSSSRGPAHDGRIKPDISALGTGEISTDDSHTYQVFGGTSAAAPTMAGSFAQLYQAYRELNNNENPKAGFLKAVVLNSARDLGNEGPDFIYGWGLVDAFRGLKILEEQTYIEGSLVQGETNQHQINIPEGVVEAKVMIYWVDKAGSTTTQKALVNDLDMFINDQNSNRHDPWILDHTPDPQLLDLPATKGADHLNNMEQVSIDTPAAGIYEVTVDGTTIPIGAQEYHIVWSFQYDDIMVTYPIGGEGFVPESTEWIHWEAQGEEGTFDVVYSLDEGLSWSPIATNLQGDTRVIDWTVPSVISGDVMVGVSRGNKFDISDETFSIIEKPSGLVFTELCRSGAKLSWQPVEGADAYQVYKLGEKYMEVVEIVEGLSVTFKDLPVDETSWFSVQAINDDGAIGCRADAVSYYTHPAYFNCKNTVSIEKIASTDVASAGDVIDYTITVKSHYEEAITGVVLSDVLDPSWEVIENSITCGFIEDGVLIITHGVLEPDESVTCSFSVVSSQFNATELIISENHDTPSTFLSIDSIDGPEIWNLLDSNSLSGSSAWFVRNIGEDQLQSLETIPFLIDVATEFSFHHNYNTELGWDGGMVEITIDDGVTWRDLGPMMLKNGYVRALGKGSNQDISYRDAFTGDSGGYIETTIDLSSYAGSTAKVRFLWGADRSFYKDGWFIDDIKIQSVFRQINQACVSFDQGDMVCDVAETFIVACTETCSSCEDNEINGEETGVDCGGPSCPPCPCSSVADSLVIQDMVLTNDMDQKIKMSIMTTDTVSIADDASVILQAGKEVIFGANFSTGNQSTMTILIEDCDEN